MNEIYSCYNAHGFVFLPDKDPMVYGVIFPITRMFCEDISLTILLLYLHISRYNSDVVRIDLGPYLLSWFNFDISMGK